MKKRRYKQLLASAIACSMVFSGVPATAYAAENGMTINYFNTACQTIRTKAVEDLVESLINPREDTMYIYKAADEGNCIDTHMEYEAVDGVIVGMVKKQG